MLGDPLDPSVLEVITRQPLGFVDNYLWGVASKSPCLLIDQPNSEVKYRYV